MNFILNRLTLLKQTKDVNQIRLIIIITMILCILAILSIKYEPQCNKILAKTETYNSQEINEKQEENGSQENINQKDEQITVTQNDERNLEEAKKEESAEIDDNKNENLEEANNAETIAIINDIQISVLPVTGKISSRYGEASSRRVSLHTGLDIACTTGTNIQVVADGTVTFSEYKGSYGNLIKVDHGNGVETWYGHCSKLIVKTGDTVKAGDVIGLVGSTGNSTGPHLHFEIRINGETVNPQNYIY